VKALLSCLLLAALTFCPAFAAKPVVPAKGGKAPTPKVEEAKEGKIDGLEIKRPSGTYLGVEISGGRMIVRFYDEKKQGVPADAARASARWNPSQKSGSQFMVLNRSEDGKALVGAQSVQPPYNFRLFLTLLSAEGTVLESHSVHLRL